VNRDLEKKLSIKNVKSNTGILQIIDEIVSFSLIPIKCFNLFYTPHQNAQRNGVFI